MELADEDVFDVGPVSRRETLALFEQIEKQRKENFKRDGMVAFFDLLGYKEIATRGEEDGFCPHHRQQPIFTEGKRTGTVRLLLEAAQTVSPSVSTFIVVAFGSLLCHGSD